MTSPYPLYLLGVDPAASSGWALWRDARLMSFGTLVLVPSGRRKAPSPSCAVWDWWGATVPPAAAREGSCVLVVESHGARMRNATTAERLIEHRRTWEVVAELAGWTVERVLVQTWQAAILGRGRKGAEKEIAMQVSAAAAKASGMTFPTMISEDAADAICVGRYYLDTARLRAAQGG